MAKKIEYRNFDNMASAIRKTIPKIKEDFDLIVGIPRSGMIPAYMIALFKNIKACSIDEFINGVEVSNGLSRSTKKVAKIKNVLIVDDSLHSGVALSNVKKRLAEAGLNKKYNIKYLAVFAREASINLVDYYCEIVPTPRMFEWNYLNININERSCFDIDGVLCVDPTPEQNDDGEEYKKFLLNAKPLYIPTYTIHTIVTSRLEKYRKETETWLKKNGVKYNNLKMLNVATKEERIRLGAHSKFKAQVYLESPDTEMFVESEPKQAEEIAKITGKPVICTANDKLYKFDEQPKFDLINLKDYEKAQNKKKILLYSHEFTYTGAPHSLRRICNVILKMGHFVEVWGPIDGEFKTEFEKLGVTVRIVPYSVMNLPNIKQAIEQFDLALVNTAIPWQAYNAFVNIIPTIWYIREATNLPDICKGVPGRESALKAAKELYCVSEYAAEFIKSTYNKNVKVIHNCMEDYAETFENKVNKKVNFVNLGTITERKAFDVYLDAFEKLPKEYQERAHLYFAGRLIEARKSYWEPILQQADKNSNITYVGEITDIAEKVEFLKKMNVVVVPSRDESCSLVVLEGAMMSKPLIVTENVGAKYMVNKDNGYIVKTGSVEELSEAFKKFIDNSDKIPKMGEASRKSYEEKASIELYEKNIGKMIEDHLKIDVKKYRNSKKMKGLKKINLIKKAYHSLKKEGSSIAFQKLLIKLGLRKTSLTAKRTFVLGSSVSSKAVDLAELAIPTGRITSMSILSSVCKPVKNINELSNKQISTRMINIDCKKTLFDELDVNKSNYLVMDLLEERYSLTKLCIDNEDFIVTKSPKLNENLQLLANNISTKAFKFSEQKEVENVKRFCLKLKNVYKEGNIILIKTKFATKYTAVDGKIVDFDNEKLKIINNNNKRVERLYETIKQAMPQINVVDMTKYCKVQEVEGKAVSSFDYNEKYFKILKNKINSILK